MSSDSKGKVALAIMAARENIRLIRLWSGGRDLGTLKSDTMLRYAIERAFIAIDTAIKDIPRPILDAHGIPAGRIAGFRNVLAHTYDDILDDRVILTIREDLPALDTALSAMLDAL